MHARFLFEMAKHWKQPCQAVGITKENHGEKTTVEYYAVVKKNEAAWLYDTEILLTYNAK